MPMYDKFCNKCDELFVVTCRIADKELPKECPYCGSTDNEYRPSAPYSSIRPERFSATHKPSGFSEVISKIKERNPRTPLATGRNSGGTGLDFTPSS